MGHLVPVHSLVPYGWSVGAVVGHLAFVQHLVPDGRSVVHAVHSVFAVVHGGGEEHFVVVVPAVKEVTSQVGFVVQHMDHFMVFQTLEHVEDPGVNFALLDEGVDLVQQMLEERIVDDSFMSSAEVEQDVTTYSNNYVIT